MATAVEFFAEDLKETNRCLRLLRGFEKSERGLKNFLC